MVVCPGLPLQKLAFIDVAKGIRMFAKLVVPCVAVVENMSYFDADGKRYYPFGQGSGDRIQRDFGLPNLVRFPIIADLSAAGDGEQCSSGARCIWQPWLQGRQNRLFPLPVGHHWGRCGRLSLLQPL